MCLNLDTCPGLYSHEIVFIKSFDQNVGEAVKHQVCHGSWIGSYRLKPRRLPQKTLRWLLVTLSPATLRCASWEAEALGGQEL